MVERKSMITIAHGTEMRAWYFAKTGQHYAHFIWAAQRTNEVTQTHDLKASRYIPGHASMRVFP